MKRSVALLISTGVAAFTLMAVLAVAAPRLNAAPPTATTAPNVIFMTATPPPTSAVQAGAEEGAFVGSFDDDGEGGEREGGEREGEHEGAEVEFKGRVKAITDQVWTIGGQTVWITEQTKIKGGVQVGDFVEVHAVAGEDGVLLAREIEVED